MSDATPSLRPVIEGFARSLVMASRLPPEGARNVVLEEARDVDFDSSTRVIEEIRPRPHQGH
jgi:hypothetical protein